MSAGLRILLPLLLGLLLAGVGIGFFFAGGSRNRGEDPPRRVLLLTGFGPFGVFDTNPSWEAARVLDGEVIGRTVVRTAQLDVVYARAHEQLTAAIEETRPDRVLCLGVAAGEHLRVEVVARNRDACPHADNAGEIRANQPIRPGGPDLLPSRLPVRKILERLAAAGFAIKTSEDAGGYLCNHVFYGVVDGLPDETVAGFVHVPSLGEAWDLERLRAAVRLLVEVLDES